MCRQMTARGALAAVPLQSSFDSCGVRLHCFGQQKASQDEEVCCLVALRCHFFSGGSCASQSIPHRQARPRQSGESCLG